MRLWSHHTCRRLSKETARLSGYRQRPQCRLFPEKDRMDKKGKVVHTFSRCLLSNLKESQGQPGPAATSLSGDTAYRLRQIALNWFTGTQAPLLLRGSSFPAWFQGFISRRDAEDQLKDKPLGCFLIRLSDKAVGYILSYRGRDRCRHFVITQDDGGKFIVVGDTETHSTLTGLVEYYMSRPIEPFGEYLTSSCLECSVADVYDVVQPGGSSDISTKWAPAVPPRNNRKPALASGFLESKEVPLIHTRSFPSGDALEKCARKNRVLHAKQNQTVERIQAPLTSRGGRQRVEAVRNRVRGAHQAGGFKQVEPFPCPAETVYSELLVDDHSWKSVQTKQRPHKHSSPPQDRSLLDRNSGKTMNKLCNSPLFQKTRGCLESGQTYITPPHPAHVWYPPQYDSVTYSTVCHQSSPPTRHTYEQTSDPGNHSAAMATPMKQWSTCSQNI